MFISKVWLIADNTAFISGNMRDKMNKSVTCDFIIRKDSLETTLIIIVFSRNGTY